MGSYTIQQVLNLTHKYFATRFDYKMRDVLRRVVIKKRKEINVKDPSRPQYYFQIETFSYPQYGEYLSMTGSGRTRQYQRTIRHEYESVLTLQELSMQTKVWKYRIGSQKKWVSNPPAKQIKQVSRKLQNQYRQKATRIAGRNGTASDVNREYKKLIARHKRNAKYLSVGDWNAQVNGTYADFIFRDAWALKVHGHLYGQMHPMRAAPSTNPQNIPFFPKHGIALIEYLLHRGVLNP